MAKLQHVVPVGFGSIVADIGIRTSPDIVNSKSQTVQFPSLGALLGQRRRGVN